MSEQDPGFLDQKYLVDPYLNWAKAEGVPIVTGATLDLFALELGDWARFGMKGAICHLDARCDYLTAFVFELASGASSAPVRHLYEEVFYVLAGAGETEVTLANGMTQTIVWEPRKLFAVPVNATARHRAIGAIPARLVALNDLRYLMGLYRNEAFLFGNSAPMHGRQEKAVAAGLLAYPRTCALTNGEWASVPLADMSVGIDLATIDAKASTLARRQMQGRHILGVEGEGFTLSFVSDTSEMVRTDWKHGVLSALTGMSFHQHFNAGSTSARLISVELGSVSSPMFRSRRAAYGDTEVYASGAAVLAERADAKALFAQACAQA